MSNPIQMNDWGIKRFLTVILSIQLVMWGVLGLGAIGLEIPVLRQLIAFIYLAFVPGIIILRILKLHKLGNIETLLYSVGLSLTTLMLTGLLVNTLYPLVGISEPISLTPLLITISIVVLVLCAICYVRDRRFADPILIHINDVLSPPALLLYLVLFLGIFGALLVTFNHNNIPLMLLMIAIAVIVILITLGKFIPRNLYPLAVFVIGLSLIFHQSLLSQFLLPAKGDASYELFLAQNVLANARWDLTMPSSVNGMLSVSMVTPIFSEIAGITITWLFKAVYPLLFALVPLGLYRIFQKQTNDKIAFLSCFFFVSVSAFYGDVFANTRMIIAELFLVLLILLMTDKNMSRLKSAVLSIIFCFSLVVSHYALSYIYIFCLIFAWLIVILMDSQVIRRLRDNLSSKLSRQNNKGYISNPTPMVEKGKMVSLNFVVLAVLVTFAWYMYTSGSVVFIQLVNIGKHIASNIFGGILDPETVEGLQMILAPTYGPLGHINKTINYLNQIFVVIGVLTLVLQRFSSKANILLGASLEGEMRFGKEYTAFSYVSLMICFASVSVSYFTSAFNIARLYHVMLFFLAPFYVIGGMMVLKWIVALKHAVQTNLFSNKKTVNRVTLKNKGNLLILVLIVSILFHFFTTGFAYTVVGRGHSLALDYGSQLWRITQPEDVAAARWLYAHSVSGGIYIEDNLGGAPFLCADPSKGEQFRTITPVDIEEIEDGDYIHLRYGAISAGKIYCRECQTGFMGLDDTIFIREGNKIYDCGSAVYQMPYQKERDTR